MEPATIGEERTFSPQGDAEVTRYRRGDLFDPGCPTREVLDRLGSKWIAMIVTLLGTPGVTELRFAELEHAMPGVSHRMLSQELKRLTADSLVTRRVEDSVPPKVFYGLTPLGRSLEAALAVLRTWSEEHVWELTTSGRPDAVAI